MHFAHILSDNTTSCQLRSEESALSCPRRPRRRSRKSAPEARIFSDSADKKSSLQKTRLHFWGVLLKYRWRVVGCGVPDAPCTARKFGAAPDACTCHCRGAACRSRRGTDGQCRLPIKWQTPKVCHCEAPKGPWQSRAGSYVFAEGSPVIQTGTARFPRRFAPRNDNSGAFTILTIPCTSC